VSPEEIAAVIVEPIQGEGGYIVPPPEFHQKLRDFTRRNNILLIMDEIQSGMGRTGKFLAIEHFQVEPDVVLLAKGLAAGLPLGAVISKKKYMSWKAGSHGSTFGGNPLSCEASLEALRLLQEGLMANAASTGSYLIRKLNELKEQYSMIGDVRGIGLMVGVELIEDGPNAIPLNQLVHDIAVDAFSRGLLLLPCGESTIRFSPPLIVTEREVDLALKIFAEVLSLYSSTREER
jgi:4-aminobutyrate aminotransferase